MNLRSFRLSAAGLSILLLGGCGLLGLPTEKTFYLDHYMEECASFFLTICEREKEREGDHWRTRLDGIEGFTYEWGFVYGLRVSESRVYNPPADGSSIHTQLLKLISKKRVPSDTRFAVALTTLDQGEPVVVEVSETLFAFHNAKTFTCVTDTLCAEIALLIGQKGILTLEFAHPETSGDPLLAQRVVNFEALQN